MPSVERAFLNSALSPSSSASLLATTTNSRLGAFTVAWKLQPLRTTNVGAWQNPDPLLHCSSLLPPVMHWSHLHRRYWNCYGQLKKMPVLMMLLPPLFVIPQSFQPNIVVADDDGRYCCCIFCCCRLLWCCYWNWN